MAAKQSPRNQAEAAAQTTGQPTQADQHRQQVAQALRQTADHVEQAGAQEGQVSTGGDVTSEAWARILPLVQGVLNLVQWLRGRNPGPGQNEASA